MDAYGPYAGITQIRLGRHEQMLSCSSRASVPILRGLRTEACVATPRRVDRAGQYDGAAGVRNDLFRGSQGSSDLVAPLSQAVCS